MNTIIVGTHNADELNAFSIPTGEIWIELISENKQSRLIAIHIQRTNLIPDNLVTFLTSITENTILLHHGDYYSRLNLHSNILKLKYDCKTGGITNYKSKNREIYEELISQKFNVFEKVWKHFNQEDPDEEKLRLLHNIQSGNDFTISATLLNSDEIKKALDELKSALDNKKYDNDNNVHRNALIKLRDTLLPNNF